MYASCCFTASIRRKGDEAPCGTPGSSAEPNAGDRVLDVEKRYKG
jgi:hypothetical protein